MSEFIRENIDPPQRVEILKVKESMYHAWKPGQFAYAIHYTTEPAVTVDSHTRSRPGELVFVVAKRKEGSGGYYFSPDALRFTQPPRNLLANLSDDERVAVDLLIGNGKRLASLPTLVPDPAERARVMAIAAQLRSLRAR